MKLKLLHSKNKTVQICFILFHLMMKFAREKVSMKDIVLYGQNRFLNLKQYRIFQIKG